MERGAGRWEQRTGECGRCLLREQRSGGCMAFTCSSGKCARFGLASSSYFAFSLFWRIFVLFLARKTRKGEGNELQHSIACKELGSYFFFTVLCFFLFLGFFRGSLHRDRYIPRFWHLVGHLLSLLFYTLEIPLAKNTIGMGGSWETAGEGGVICTHRKHGERRDTRRFYFFPLLRSRRGKEK